MSAPFANIVGLLKKHRYAVLASAMLSALAVPQWGVAADNTRNDGTAVRGEVVYKHKVFAPAG